MQHHEKLVAIHWGVAFCAAVALQLGLYYGVDKDLSYLVTTVLIVLIPSIFYGKHMCCGSGDGSNINNNDALVMVDQETTTPAIMTTVVEADDEHQLRVQVVGRPQRLHFLDSLKIFLTFTVVTHHVTCAFGGCGRFWYLVVGDYDSTFRFFASAYVLLNQAYFMPLFFFVSAVFTEGSYAKKGHEQFLKDKAKRIWLPALVTSFTVVPASLLIGQAMSDSDLHYFPSPGPTWFLFWLLVFNWVYATIQRARLRNTAAVEENDDANSDVADTAENPFPRICCRWMWGLFVCGFGALVVYVALKPVFYSMPIAVGSFANDHVLFFVAGIASAKYSWLQQRLSELTKLGWLFVGVGCEAIALVGLFVLVEDQDAWGMPFFAVAGIYCVDISLLLLVACQRYFDRPMRFMSEAAYGVYLLHPVIVTGCTAIFVHVYNTLYDDAISFGIDCETGKPDDEILISCSEFQKEWHLLLGWLTVGVASHFIVWPAAWLLRRLPGFKQVL